MPQIRCTASYVPSADVSKFCDKHKAEIDAGASVWDLRPTECFEKQEYFETQEELENALPRIHGQDEFGEVHLRKEKYNKRLHCWEIMMTAIFDGVCEIEWCISLQDAA